MTPKKKILVFVDWYKPGYKAGGPIQSVYNLVTRLQSDFDFHIFTSDTDLCELQSYSSVQSDTWTEYEEIPVFYASKKSLSFFKIKQIVKDLQPDVVYTNSMFSFYYAIVPLLLNKLGKINKMVLAPRGMLGKGALGVKSSKKGLFFKLVSFLGIYKNIIFQATSQQEVQDIKVKFGSKTNILLSQNLPSLVSNVELRSTKKKSELNLISLARISPEKGLLHLLIALKSIDSKVNLDLYGPINDIVYWSKCEQVITELSSNISVSYNGGIESDKVKLLLPNYDFLALTTLGENFGHSIFQAFSVGVPVIISNKTPWGNLFEKGIGWDVALEKKQIVNILLSASNLNTDQHLEMKQKALQFAKQFSNNKELVNSAKQLFTS